MLRMTFIRRRFSWFIALLCVASLSACSTLSVDFSDWASTYNKAVEKAHNENLLMNLVRAAYNQPLHFTTIPIVRGGGSITPSFGLTSVYTPTGNYVPKMFNWLGAGVGQAAASVTPNLGLTVSSTFGFDMATLDNAEFMAGFLTPLSPSAVHFYVAQGIPRELLFHLFIQRIELVDKTHTVELENDPFAKSYGKFTETLNNLLELGLWTQSVNVSAPFGPPLSADNVRNLLPAILQGPARLQIVPVTGSIGPEYQLQSNTIHTSFCIKKLPETARIISQTGLCDEVGMPKATRVSNQQANILEYEGGTLRIVLRSTREIFNYLGNQLYSQVSEQRRAPLIMRTQEAKDYNYMNHGDSLLVVNKGQSHSDDLYRVQYRGDTYSVPSRAEGHSALVFTILAQVLVLNKAVNLLPASTPVLVR